MKYRRPVKPQRLLLYVHMMAAFWSYKVLLGTEMHKLCLV